MIFLLLLLLLLLSPRIAYTRKCKLVIHWGGAAGKAAYRPQTAPPSRCHHPRKETAINACMRIDKQASGHIGDRSTIAVAYIN